MGKKCVACLQRFTWECLWGGNCDAVAEAVFAPVKLRTPSTEDERYEEFVVVESREINDVDLPDMDEDENEAELSIREQDDSSLKDQQSTGRKRAAKLYPLDPDKDCEWSQKKSCGGG